MLKKATRGLLRGYQASHAVGNFRLPSSLVTVPTYSYSSPYALRRVCACFGADRDLYEYEYRFNICHGVCLMHACEDYDSGRDFLSMTRSRAAGWKLQDRV